MKIIISDEQLRRLIPNVFATVEGEPTLYEKLTPFLESAEEWAKENFVSENVFEQIAYCYASTDAVTGDDIKAMMLPIEKLIACHAYMSAIPSLDLVMTPNGFGIVSNTNVVPASKERIERLITSLETERDSAAESLVLKLASNNEWQQTSQGKYFGSTMFPFLGLCQRLAIREHVWTNYQRLHDRLIKIENVLAETYFSQEQMAVLRLHVMTQMKHAQQLEERVIRTLQSLEMMLLSDIQVHTQSYYDLVNIMREHESFFPAWHASEVAELYSPATFSNKKGAGGYWF